MGVLQSFALGEILDGEGKIFLRATLESSDADQRLFAEQCPAETAKGFPRFSLDGYRDTETNREGRRTQTHYTYKYLWAGHRMQLSEKSSARLQPEKPSPQQYYKSSRVNKLVLRVARTVISLRAGWQGDQ